MRRHGKVVWKTIGMGLALWVAACGGARETPTPLPAAGVRPEQPAPVYPASTAFQLETPADAIIVVTPPALLSIDAEKTTPQAPVLDMAFLQPPPTGLGIAQGGAALFAEPNGALIQQLPAGATVTLTGKARITGWLAAYAANGERGWVAANAFTLFGEETLETVDQPFDPSFVATRIAVDMAPIAMPTIVLTGMLTATVEP